MLYVSASNINTWPQIVVSNRSAAGLDTELLIAKESACIDIYGHTRIWSVRNLYSEFWVMWAALIQ